MRWDRPFLPNGWEKKRIIAETGAGQHGIATASVCARFGLECKIYMGAEDMRRQALNVFKMRLSGAEVHGVETGSKTLKEAINEAMRDWVTNVRSTHYILGSALGAHPYPLMVRDFHRIIGRETKKQFRDKAGQLPNELIACVGGGSNAIGFFFDFLDESDVQLTGVEAGGRSLKEGEHAARFEGGSLEFFKAARHGFCKIVTDRSTLLIPFQQVSTTRPLVQNMPTTGIEKE